MFAEIALFISTFQSFTYKIPSDLIHNAHIGSRVKVQLGRRLVYGVIISLNENSIYEGDVKSISEIIDDIPILTKELWELIQWMSYYYVAPIGKVFNTVLPISLSKNYSPQFHWYARHLETADKIAVDELKKNAPIQYNVYKKIKKESPVFFKISSLKTICSNPVSICNSLEKKKLIQLIKKEKDHNPTDLSFEPVEKKIHFNSDQNKVINKLENCIESGQFNSLLLHGVTGSGKTEIFIEIIKRVLDRGKSGIILLPEIALTPQIAGRFKSVFGDKTALWHSQLTQSQRSSTWKKLYNGKYKIVIGARSALFAPLKNLGLIIVDEEHDTSYKQDSPSPRYHARDVAIMRAKLERSSVLLSSATPSLESYYNYQCNKYEYLSLPNRYGRASYPTVKIVDLLEESEESGKINTVISGTLLDKIEDRLNKNEQILLIQNRRGYSPSVRCSDCGDVIMCLACKTALTYHKQDNNLMCHICGYIETKLFDNCKNCMSHNLIYVGTGTQRVEKILGQTFPNARIARVDHDSMKSGSDMVKTLQSFLNGKLDIIIGTQMIAKGLDFPEVTLVGIINADLGLHLPDFRASERIFQLIYQAAGRSGRGEKPGEVIIQTYDKNNPVIKAASKLDLNRYYKIMLDDRTILKYPPYSWITKIEFIGPNTKSVLALSNKIRNSLSNHYKGLEILGPAACFKEKIKNNFRFQIILKSIKIYDSNGEKLHSFINCNFFKDKPIKTGANKINIHVDPISMI